MREWQGTIDSIKAKQDLPELLGMLKSYVAVSMRVTEKPEE